MRSEVGFGLSMAFHGYSLCHNVAFAVLGTLCRVSGAVDVVIKKQEAKWNCSGVLSLKLHFMKSGFVQRRKKS